MKCPKCGYLGFESVDRCRNCGYDFSLTPFVDVLELPLKPTSTTSPSPEVPGRHAGRSPLDDLSFLDEAMASESVHFSGHVKSDARGRLERERPLAPPSEDLPLFGAALSDDVPLITRPSAPRPPLAVRRATPDAPRSRSVSARADTLDLDLESPARVTRAHGVARAMEAVLTSEDVDVREDATVGARFAAFVTDTLILAAIDAVVVYFTLQICGIGLQELNILPRAPLLAFLLVQNGGYLVAFTAGGQTLGKMAAGIKVVSAEPRSSLDVGRAFVRELLWLVLAAPAGLGLLTVLSRDRRGIHDRFAGTRVVRV
jgi:uncharacterized RDD family membrane protein YckC